MGVKRLLPSKSARSVFAALLLSGLALLALEHLFFTCVLRVAPNLGDEGVAALGAIRILAGQSPHADFFEIIPSLSFLPTALFFKMLGQNALAMRLLTLVYAVGLVWMTDHILKRFASGRIRVAAAALLVVSGVTSWPMPSHHWAADLLQLGAACALLKAAEMRHATQWAALSGLLVAAAGFTLQDQGFYFCLALLLLVFPWRGEFRKRALLPWTAGVCCGALIFFGAAWAQASLREIVCEWVLFPVTRYKEINEGGLFLGWVELLKQDLAYEMLHDPVHLVTRLFLELCSWLAPAALLPVFFRWWRSRRDDATPGILLALMIGFYSTCLHRWALTNLGWALPSAVLGIGWLAGKMESESSPSSPALRKAALVLVAVCALNALSTQWMLRPSNIERIATAVGEYALPKKQTGQAQRVRNAVNAIRSLVPEGEPVLIHGFIPSLAFYVGRPPLSRFNFFLAGGYHTEEQLREIQSLLRSRKSSYIVAAKPLRPDLPFDAWLMRTANPLWMNDLIVIFRMDGGPGGPENGRPAAGPEGITRHTPKEGRGSWIRS